MPLKIGNFFVCLFVCFLFLFFQLQHSVFPTVFNVCCLFGWFILHSMNRMDKLQVEYGFTDFYTVGMGQLRKMFPYPGLTETRNEGPIPESYPGNVSLYEFVYGYGHDKEDMIKM